MGALAAVVFMASLDDAAIATLRLGTTTRGTTLTNTLRLVEGK